MMLRSFYQRFLISKALAIELLASTFLINVLALATPLFVIQILSRYLVSNADRTLITLSFGVIIAIILEICFRQLRNRLASMISLRSHRNFSYRVTQALVYVKSSFLEQLSSHSRQEMIRDLDSMQKAYNSSHITLLLDIPFVFIFLLVILLLSPILALVVCLAIVLSSLVNYLGLHYAKNHAAPLNDVQINQNSLLLSTLQTADTIRAYNSQPTIHKNWENIYQRLQALQAVTDQQQSFTQNLIQGVGLLAIVLIIGIGAKL